MKPTQFQNRRHILLVDHVLQKSLLLALVVMETVGVAIAIWMLYRALGRIVDENTYRVHFSGSVDVLSLLLREGMRVLGAMLLVNVLALVVADRIWAFYVKGIVKNLGSLIGAAGRLDFTEQERPSFHHAVLEQASVWRHAELKRLSALRGSVRCLPAQLPATAQEKESTAATLKKMKDE